MLDNVTKKNIDDCRDVLVGKVPDPKSQIEQITLALIYKFMDDMDKEAVDKFKGNAKFFTGEYSKYGWRKLFDPSLSGQDMLALYSEALEKLNTNPNIPELFRNIFKNAYLPYRDPSTLKLFLKYINEFEYSHSEKLGDAFEYLLSVMGSQGDAGQFRTPRHLIDFVTACVNPQKNETVLDPACGTAGFLLSAYKHIINYELRMTNDELEESKKDEDSIIGDAPLVIKKKKFVIGLTPDERRKLGQNIVGYDISPDMVRLSLANMYLHGFATPLIHEYDTLSSEDRWQETFDVILANPPFMTPKGGIRPHKKFGVQANKAEVLFTDYIAEHLNSNGRAGIVVPNGIVATSQTAYKQLRKMLVQDSLIAVISLPAGVFQPYSGVKTSVLILDKRLAKKSKHILFLKIENDGYDLGAQRREIDKNDLPLALQTFEAYKEYLDHGVESSTDTTEILAEIQNHLDHRINGLTEDTDVDSKKSAKSHNPRKSAIQTIATLVEKEIVLGNKDVVLTAERYFKAQKATTEFDLVKIGELCSFEYGKPLKEENRIIGIYPVHGSNGIVGYHNEYIVKGPFIIIGRKGTAGAVNFSEKNGFPIDTTFYVLLNDKFSVDLKYLYFILRECQLGNLSEQAGVPGLNRNDAYEFEIPLPPLEIQQQIVTEIEGYQKIIDGAKQVVNNYKPTITINLDWEMVELGKVCEIITDGTHQTPDYKDEGIIFLSSKNVMTHVIDWHNVKYISKEAYEKNTKVIKPKLNDILLAKNGINSGNAAIVDKNIDFSIYVSLALLRPKLEMILPNYFLRIINTQNLLKEFQSRFKGMGVPNLHLNEIREVKIPLPSFEEQQTIVNAIEEEMELVNANKRLIELFEQKIKEKINKVWGAAPKEYAMSEENMSLAAEE